jgi:hypothetical protein
VLSRPPGRARLRRVRRGRRAGRRGARGRRAARPGPTGGRGRARSSWSPTRWPRTSTSTTSWSSTRSRASRRGRCCVARCGTNGRPRGWRPGRRADGRPPLTRAAGPARLGRPDRRPARPPPSASSATPSGPPSSMPPWPGRLAGAADRRRMANRWPPAWRRASSPRSWAGDWPMSRSSGPTWPASSAGWPARRRRSRSRRWPSDRPLVGGWRAVDGRAPAGVAIDVQGSVSRPAPRRRTRRPPPGQIDLVRLRSVSISPARQPASTPRWRSTPLDRRGPAAHHRGPGPGGRRSASRWPVPTWSEPWAARCSWPALLRRPAPAVRRPIGSFQAVQHLLADAFVHAEGARSVTLHAAWAVDALPSGDALAAAAVAKAYCARAPARCARPPFRCTAGSATPGSAWPTSTSGVPAVERPPRRCRRQPVAGAPSPGIGAAMDFVTHPPSRSSGCDCGTGCRTTTPACPRRRPTTTTGRAWRPGTSSLYDAGFFGMSWPTAIGGQGLPSVYEVIVDEELAAAGAPPRPSVGYLVQGILEHGSDEIQSASSPASSTGATGGARGSASPTPDPTWPRCAPGPTATATTSSSPATRCGRATRTTPSGACSWPGPTTTWPSTAASRRSPSRCANPASSSDPSG